MLNENSLTGSASEAPDLAFCLVPAYMACEKRIRGDGLRVATVTGGWSGPAAELIPLQDSTEVSRVSMGVASDRGLPPQALRIAIAFGVDVDAAGCFLLDLKVLGRRLRPMGIDERQIGKSLDAMIGGGHIRQLAAGRFQIQTNRYEFMIKTELD